MFAFFAALLAAGPVQSAARCDLALLFAVDVSASISTQEFDIQIDGIVQGLGDEIVADAVVRQQAALAVLLWSGHRSQQLSIGWTGIGSLSDLQAFRGQLSNLDRPRHNQPTALGAAMGVAREAFAMAPPCARRVVDVSGDGKSNEGALPSLQRRALEGSGIVVNALAIETDVPELSEYFRQNVIVGEDSFVLAARSFDEFALVMREKLYREINIQMVQSQTGEGTALQ